MLKSTRAALAIGLGLVGVAGFVGRSKAQDPAVRKAAGTAPVAPPPPAVIATVDLDAVLKGYDKFNYLYEAIQAEMLAKHNELMKIQSEAQAEMEKSQKLAPNSPDQKLIEQKMLQLKAQHQAYKEQAQVEVVRKEAETFSMMLNEIQAMTGSIARQKGITLVIKYSANATNPTDKGSIDAAMTRSVVYADPKMDITQDTIKWLNYFYEQAKGPKPKGDLAKARPAGGAGQGASPAGGQAPATAAQPRETVPR